MIGVRNGRIVIIAKTDPDVGVGDDTEHLAPRSILFDQAFDVGFLDSESSHLRATEILKITPAAIGQIAAQSLSQQFAPCPSFAMSKAFRFAQQPRRYRQRGNLRGSHTTCY
jgi:hypothetical protein